MATPATLPKALSPESIMEVGSTRLFGGSNRETSWLISGWAAPEDQHVWNDGPEAILRIVTVPVKRAVQLSFEGVPFIDGACSRQDVTLYVNGLRVGFWRLRDATSSMLSATIEREQIMERDGKAILFCALHMPDSRSPANLGVGKDTRELGFCFRSVALS